MKKKTPFGRPQVEEHLQRKVLSGFRLPKWQIDFLKREKGQGGKMIEKAIMEFYRDELKSFYENKY